MKHILSLVILSIVLCSNIVYAQDDLNNVLEPSHIISNQSLTIDKTLNKEIQDSIIDIYGKENAEQIYDKFLEKVENSIKCCPKELL